METSQVFTNLPLKLRIEQSRLYKCLAFCRWTKSESCIWIIPVGRPSEDWHAFVAVYPSIKALSSRARLLEVSDLYSNTEVEVDIVLL